MIHTESPDDERPPHTDADRRRFLIATVPATGHVTPAVPVARALVERGHEVRWYTGRDHKATVESTGASYEPLVAAHDTADASFNDRMPGRAALEGLAAVKFDLKHLFLDEVPLHLADLEAILGRFDADVVLTDPGVFAARYLHERGGPPYATLGISILPMPSRDAPPVGSGRAPSSSPIRRRVDRLSASAAQRLLFRDVEAHHRQLRTRLGLDLRGPRVFDLASSPFLYLHGSTPSFEYPRSDLPRQVHLVGPYLGERPTVAAETRSGAQRPLVLVTQGTVAIDPHELVVPALEALADADVRVVATAGRHATTLAEDAPGNAVVHDFVPFADLMPQAAVFVTNGGYGGIQMALAHGVPVLVVGATEDKPDVGARVAWSGVGRYLPTRTPTADELRREIDAVLHEPNHRDRARAIADEIAGTDAARTAADLLEQLAHTGAPVLRAPTPSEP